MEETKGNVIELHRTPEKVISELLTEINNYDQVVVITRTKPELQDQLDQTFVTMWSKMDLSEANWLLDRGKRLILDI